MLCGARAKVFPLLTYEIRTYSTVKLKENRNSTHSLFLDDYKKEVKNWTWNISHPYTVADLHNSCTSWIKKFFNFITRRFPCGIQRLVSIHHLPYKSLDGGGGLLQTNSNSKFLNLAKFSWGGGLLQTNTLKILEWVHSRNFQPKILVTGMW